MTQMATIALEHNSQRSPLTVSSATCQSRVALPRTEQAIPDPSEFRVGSSHVPEARAIVVPTFRPSNGPAS